MKITAVLPVRNKADVLDACLRSVRIAAAAYADCSVIVVDNGSTDGSLRIQESYRDAFTLLRSTAARVGGVRNDGARGHPKADVYAFIDCDCIVPERFFTDVADVFAESKASAVGCEVVSDMLGHWSEVVWDKLHRPGGDGPRHYINSACFCITASWFWKINGFDEQKVSSEDVDICRRLTVAGGTMWQAERLAVIHMGNPKSLSGLYRRLRWHGEGIFEAGKGVQWSVSTIFTLLHAVVVVVGVTAGVLLLTRGRLLGAPLMLASLVSMPALFVLARAIQFRRGVPVFGGIALMMITFAARFAGMRRSIVGAART